MTEMDLRIAFKMDTGYYPLWAKNHDGSSVADHEKYAAAEFTFIKGVPTSLYGRWLEEKTGKTSKYLRELYYKRTGEKPTWFYFQPGYDRYREDVLIRDYCWWLESFILRFKPEVVRNIMKVD